MSGLNSVTMIGRLTEEPDMKYINDTTKTRFNIAVNRQYTDSQGNSRKETTFVPIVVWGKQAETCAEYLSKGRLVAVDGRLRIDSFENNEGEKRKVIEIIARNVQFLDAPGVDIEDQKQDIDTREKLEKDLEPKTEEKTFKSREEEKEETTSETGLSDTESETLDKKENKIDEKTSSQDKNRNENKKEVSRNKSKGESENIEDVVVDVVSNLNENSGVLEQKVIDTVSKDYEVDSDVIEGAIQNALSNGRIFRSDEERLHEI